MMKPSVIDLSHHNAVLSFDDLRKSGILGIIHKASQGVSYGDADHDKRRDPATKAGILWGSYHFATNADPAAQVDWFLKHAKPDASTLLALDWENNPDGPDMSPTQARAFLTLLMQKTGRTPRDIWIYGGNVLKERIVTHDDCVFFGQFPLWLCQYGPAAKLPKAWTSYRLWQYSDTGHVVGMAKDGHVDLNVYSGNDLAGEWAPSASLGDDTFPIPAADPPKTVSAIASATDIAKTVQSSHSLWAIINGWVIGGVAMLTDWMQNAFLWAASLVTDITKEVDDSGVVDSAGKLQDWLQLDKALIVKFTVGVVLAISVIVFIRHLTDRRAAS